MAEEELRVLEFFSGIGGYHIALKELCAPFKVVAAVEISSNANQIYTLNFPDTPVLEKNICGLKPKDIDKLNANVFVMSPPCQPYSRQGNQKDTKDNRTNAVIHMFEIFSELERLPEYFFIENVKGFETSDTREILLKFFKKFGFHTQEFLINSNQLSIPNSRLRYYLLARRSHSFQGPDGLQSSIPEISEDKLKFKRGLDLGKWSSSEVRCLKSFLVDEDITKYELQDVFIGKWGRLLDLVTPNSTRSCCFTKGYSVKAEGSGSVLQMAAEKECVATDNFSNNALSASNVELEGAEFLEHMKLLKLRYFTPREIARIHGIPDWYSFPDNLSDKQLYKLLGNGLNVTVIQILFKFCLFTN